MYTVVYVNYFFTKMREKDSCSNDAYVASIALDTKGTRSAIDLTLVCLWREFRNLTINNTEEQSGDRDTFLMDSAESGKKMETGISAGPRARKWLGAITPLFAPYLCQGWCLASA